MGSGGSSATADAGDARPGADSGDTTGTGTGGGGGTGGSTGSGGGTGTGGGIGTGGGTGTGGSTSPSTCGAPAKAQAPSGITPFRAIDGFVTRNGSTLSLCGQPFSVLGANLYYLQSYSVYEAGNLRTVADGLDDAVRMSLPVIRTWAYYDGSGTDTALIMTAPGTYSEKALVGLDTTIAEAKKRGVRLILTLTDYWTGYGGLPQYAQWAGVATSSTDQTAAQAFYTNATMQKYFTDYATMLSKRTNTVTGVAYKDEPTILAWEIANELRCPTCADASPVTATVDTLSKLLKSLFPKHLIADGGEGMDDAPANWGTFSNNYPVSGWERTSYTSLVKLTALDMVSYHYYPADWGMAATPASTVNSDGQAWIDGHAVLAKAAGKVAYWGEFGLQKGATDAVRAPIYDGWLTTFFGATENGALAMFWQLVPQSRGADDGFACILGRDPATVAVFEKYSVARAPR